MRKFLIAMMFLSLTGSALAQRLLPVPGYATSGSAPPAAGAPPQYYVQLFRMPFNPNSWLEGQARDGWRMEALQLTTCPVQNGAQWTNVPCMMVALSREPR